METVGSVYSVVNRIHKQTMNLYMNVAMNESVNNTVRKYLFKVNNKNTITYAMEVVLMSPMLTLNKYLLVGRLTKNILKVNKNSLFLEEKNLSAIK